MKRKSKRSVLYYTRLMEQQWPVSRYDFILLNELKKEKRKKSEGIIKLHNAQIWFFFFLIWFLFLSRQLVTTLTMMIIIGTNFRFTSCRWKPLHLFLKKKKTHPLCVLTNQSLPHHLFYLFLEVHFLVNWLNFFFKKNLDKAKSETFLWEGSEGIFFLFYFFYKTNAKIHCPPKFTKFALLVTEISNECY